MKRSKHKPYASIGIITPANMEFPMVDRLVDTFEAQLKRIAKQEKLQIDGTFRIHHTGRANG